jgi:hypothetical protein
LGSRRHLGFGLDGRRHLVRARLGVRLSRIHSDLDVILKHANASPDRSRRGRTSHFARAETGLPGWACRIRTGESVRELSDWNSVATLPEVVQARRRRPFTCELRDTDLQLRPTFQQTIFRAADTAAPERRRTNRAMSVFDLIGPRCTRCSFVADHVRSGPGYQCSGGAPE